ncbi:hypothetical protein ASD01_33320 [Ensifer sp. Root423]|nr:hypothetical protein ASD01_33320 [Ensifer sp. Root423]
MEFVQKWNNKILDASFSLCFKYGVSQTSFTERLGATMSSLSWSADGQRLTEMRATAPTEQA